MILCASSLSAEERNIQIFKTKVSNNGCYINLKHKLLWNVVLLKYKKNTEFTIEYFTTSVVPYGE